MNLYEVTRWGNDSEDQLSGGGNGPDTNFIVRAASHLEAAAIVDARLASEPSERVINVCNFISLLGSEPDGLPGRPTMILRGPYIHHAYSMGIQSWRREPLIGDKWMDAGYFETNEAATNEGGGVEDAKRKHDDQAATARAVLEIVKLAAHTLGLDPVPRRFADGIEPILQNMKGRGK